MQENELWLPLDRFNGRYLISNLGQIKSVQNNLMLKPSFDKDGYRRISLRINNKSYFFRVGVLVARYFIPNPNNLKIVNHIDSIKTNDYYYNLEWTSVRENTCHGIKQNKLLPIGVSKRPKHNKFRARITINAKSVSLGDFDTAEEASNAYLEAHKTFNLKNKYAK